MSESIAEMILPSTYIEVRSEGLLGVGAIATGNIGIVGSAARGPRNTVVQLGSYADAVEAFGAYDSFASPTLSGQPLTLVRALEQAFKGGASSVYAVRIANGDPAKASLAVQAAGALPGFTLTAKEGGTWAHAIAVKLVDESTTGNPKFTITLAYRTLKESFSAATVQGLATALAGSLLVDVGTVSNGAAAPASIDPAQSPAGGIDRADISASDLADGLAALESQPVNIVLAGGFGSAAARGAVLAHLEATENEGRERIAVLGATASAASTVLAEAGAVSSPRLVLVGPGIVASDSTAKAAVSLPPPYLAAMVAGKLATVAPHVSLTNKTLPVEDLDRTYNTPTYKNLLQNRVFLVRQKFGFQVVKAITTDTGAFKQVSIRRIVDYAKAGVRSGSDPYIGRLNNARVRGALKATLDGFLSQMVQDEMLVKYELEVSATRAQEINGICVVVMTLMPTFSIDFIRVTMNLQ